MLRRLGLALGVVALLSAGGEAHAQFGYGYYPYGYGGYGWGGWGGTPQGSIARGLGYYAAGVGQMNEENAVAASVNTDTAMRWNEFMYLSQMEANRNERIRLQQLTQRDAAAGAALNKRAAEAPTDDDVTSGNALNAALDQITDPRVHSSALRLATTKIPGKLVRAIPFVNASEAVTISLDQLTAENGWPAALRDPAFDQDRKAYSDAVDQALKEDRDGEIKPETLARLRAVQRRLKARLDAVKPTPEDRVKWAEAENYLKSLYAMTRMLDRPDYEKIVAELDTIKETTLGSLLGFMHTFNLRFARATTPEQRAAYEQLYPILAAHRDRVLKDAGLASNDKDKGDGQGRDANPKAPPAPAFFSGMRFDRLEGPHK